MPGLPLNRPAFAGAWILLAVSLAVAAPAASEPVGATAAGEVAALRLTALQQVGGIPGMSAAVGVGDGIVWSHAVGFANLETPAAATAETKFRAASVSKVITTALLARLVAAGTLDLDAPIRRWIPELPPAVGAVTLRQLAGHVGGIRHYERSDFGPDGPDRRNFESLTAALSIFVDDPLVAPPGTLYRYSTFGYTLIGAVMERATGKDFLTLLEEELFAPLGMRGSGGDVPAAVVPGRTAFYHQVAGGRLAHPAPADPSYKWPGGGLLTTAEDLVRLGLSLLGDELVSAALREQLFRPQRLADGSATEVGLGWRIGVDWRGRTVYHHSGSMAGARSSIVLYPEQGLAAAFLTNLTGGPVEAEATAQMLAEPFLRDVEPASLPTGTFGYQGRARVGDREQKVSGWLTLRDAGPDLSGVIALPAAAVDALLADSYPRTESIAVVGRAWADQPFVVLAAPTGLLPVLVTRGGAGLELAVDLGPVGLEVSLAEGSDSQRPRER